MNGMKKHCYNIPLGSWPTISIDGVDHPPSAACWWLLQLPTALLRQTIQQTFFWNQRHFAFRVRIIRVIASPTPFEL